MNDRRLIAGWLWVALAAVTVAVNGLLWLVPGFNLAKAVIGFAWLFVLPGWAVLRLGRWRLGQAWEQLSLSVGLSILFVMLVALAINTLGPIWGISHPLNTLSLAAAFDTAWTALIVAGLRRDAKATVALHLPKPNWRPVALTVAGATLVAMAVMGAISLNNGGANTLTWLMLVLTTGYLALLIAWRKRVSETTLVSGVYWVGLALLLMTSLRGWFITGHDVQREFHVFSITLTNLHWSVATYHDAYNACLSITLLPTVIHQVMGVPALDVYKTVFQVLFALVPGLVYFIARQFQGRLVSLLAAVYFMAFPTYFTDMPMLNRQEMAFLFIGLVLLVMFHKGWAVQRRRWFVCLLGLGVILSHYTTTYLMLGMFAMVLGMRYGQSISNLVARLTGRRRRRAVAAAAARTRQTATVSLMVMAVLVAASYVWSVKLTNTGNNLSGVVGQTIASLRTGLTGDSQSSDTSYSLIGGSKLTDQQRVELYLKDTVPTARESIPAAQQYPEDSYADYPVSAQSLANLPLTAAGRWLNAHGLPVATFNKLVRQGSAAFLQLALVAGVALIWWRRRSDPRIDGEYRWFQLTSIGLLVAVVVLPVLSAQYGLLRAFQQALMVSGVAVVWATIALVPRRWRRLRLVVPSLLAIGFLLSSTGVITTALGGYPPQLHLAKAGEYYDLYYVHASEQQAADWLTQTLQTAGPSEVSTSVDDSGYLLNRISQMPNVTVSDNGVYPGVVPQNAYVFLGYTATVKDEATIYAQGNLISYRYPTSFLDDHKDLIYANNGARVYR